MVWDEDVMVEGDAAQESQKQSLQFVYLHGCKAKKIHSEKHITTLLTRWCNFVKFYLYLIFLSTFLIVFVVVIFISGQMADSVWIQIIELLSCMAWQYYVLNDNLFDHFILITVLLQKVNVVELVSFLFSAFSHFLIVSVESVITWHTLMMSW